MELELLVSRYPRLFHVAEDGSQESIREHGLLSTTALLDLFGVKGERRFAIESCWRPEIMRIEHPVYGAASIRDQQPMPEDLLLRCLEGMTLREWYETLNRKVFFWTETEHLERFLNAYADAPRIVLEVDAARLLERHADRVTLSRINSGAPFQGNPSPRGLETFRRIADHPENEPVVELAVDYAVPDVADFTLRVSRWRGEEFLKRVWSVPEER